MDNLRDVIMQAAVDLIRALHPLQEEDDSIKLQMNEDINLAENLAHLAAREALIQPRMEAISSQKDLVETAASQYEPEGKTKELVTAFFYLVKTLQSDCRKIREDIQEWDEIFNSIHSLHRQKQDLDQKQSEKANQILEMKVKDDRRRDLLELAWNVMSEEIRSSHQEESRVPNRDSTD